MLERDIKAKERLFAVIKPTLTHTHRQGWDSLYYHITTSSTRITSYPYSSNPTQTQRGGNRCTCTLTALRANQHICSPSSNTAWPELILFIRHGLRSEHRSPNPSGLCPHVPTAQFSWLSPSAHNPPREARFIPLKSLKTENIQCVSVAVYVCVSVSISSAANAQRHPYSRTNQQTKWQKIYTTDIIPSNNHTLNLDNNAAVRKMCITSLVLCLLLSRQDELIQKFEGDKPQHFKVTIYFSKAHKNRLPNWNYTFFQQQMDRGAWWPLNIQAF